LLEAMRQLEPAFLPQNVATSQAIEAVRLSDGRELLCLGGCTPHNCGGTAYAIVYDVVNHLAAFVRDSDGQDYWFYGSPDQIIMKTVLFDFAARTMEHR
jgi:hypothetical protein